MATDINYDEILSKEHEVGTYILQECNGNDSAYQTKLMRTLIL